MTNEEANQVLEELHEVRPEKLNDKAKRLFEAIMKIANDKDKYYAMVNLMADYIGQEDTTEKFCNSRYEDISEGCDEDCGLCVRKYFEKRCK